jgi:hypothetical protein
MMNGCSKDQRRQQRGEQRSEGKVDVNLQFALGRQCTLSSPVGAAYIFSGTRTLQQTQLTGQMANSRTMPREASSRGGHFSTSPFPRLQRLVGAAETPDNAWT